MLLLCDKLHLRCLLDFKWGAEFNPADILSFFLKVYISEKSF